MERLRQRYAVVTDQSWDLVRAAFVGGLSARLVCECFGKGEDNLTKRAREQGWTKRAWAAAQAVERRTRSGDEGDGPIRGFDLFSTAGCAANPVATAEIGRGVFHAAVSGTFPSGRGRTA